MFETFETNNLFSINHHNTVFVALSAAASQHNIQTSEDAVF